MIEYTILRFSVVLLPSGKCFEQTKVLPAPGEGLITSSFVFATCFRHISAGLGSAGPSVMVRKIHHMGSNISQIRISFVIIPRTCSITWVIWHENKLFNQFAIYIKCLAARLLRYFCTPGKMAALILKWSIGLLHSPPSIEQRAKL